MAATTHTATSVGPTFPLVEVSGDSYQLGYQHGRQAGDLIGRYLVWIEKLTGMPRAELCVNAERLRPNIESLSPAFGEEVRGLADGADISLAEAWLCQVRGEASRTLEGGCTAYALTGEATANGRPLCGQNQDLQPEYSDVAIVLKVRPNDGRPRAVMFTFAGQIGYSGMNEHGVAHFANQLYNFDWRPALPHYVLKRLALEQRNVEQCVQVYAQNRTCSAGNIILCDSGAVADVEVRPEGLAVFDDDDPDQRLHTNHYLTKEFTGFDEEAFPQLPDTADRLERIRTLVRRSWGTITVDTMKEMLTDHDGDPAAICRHGAAGLHTVSGYVAEPATGTLHIRRGHGCTGTWTAYEV